MRSFLQSRFAVPLTGLVLKGATPDILALSLALGLCVSCFPVLGITTILCIFLALAFRLNLPALLLANIVGFPLQILLLFPFARLGERLFQAEHLSLAPASLIFMLRSDPVQMTRQLWTWQWHAIVAWMLVVPFAALVLTLALRMPLRKLGLFSNPVAAKQNETPINVTPPQQLL